MDTDTLVDNKIEEGEKFITELLHDHFDVTAAFWVKTSEEGRWFLYIATKEVEGKGPATAYREAYTVLQSLESPWISLSEVKLVSPSNPVAHDVIENERRYPIATPTHAWQPQLGSIPIEEAYIYPKPEPDLEGLHEIRKLYPTAKVVSIKVPYTEELARHEASGKFEPLTWKVNKEEFEGRAPGTLLFLGIKQDYSAKLVFVYRQEGWNTCFRPETKRMEEVRFVATGEPPYGPADFAPLAALKLPQKSA